MKALVIVDSMFGNTEQVARAIATALAPAFTVRLDKPDQTTKIGADRIDLLIVGGPTHRQKMSEPLTALLEATPRGTLGGVTVAAFDTRYHMAAWLSGSAARGIARHLQKLGGRLIVSLESFFIVRDTPPRGQKRRHNLERLEPGEVERAAEWATEIVGAI